MTKLNAQSVQKQMDFNFLFPISSESRKKNRNDFITLAVLVFFNSMKFLYSDLMTLLIDYILLLNKKYSTDFKY